jgi:hypothetical protein
MQQVCGRRKMRRGFWWEDLKERDHLEEPYVDRIILKWIFKRWDGDMYWTVMAQERGTGDGLLWMRQWTFGFHIMRGIAWRAEELLASPEGLCSMESLYCLATERISCGSNLDLVVHTRAERWTHHRWTSTSDTWKIQVPETGFKPTRGPIMSVICNTREGGSFAISTDNPQMCTAFWLGRCVGRSLRNWDLLRKQRRYTLKWYRRRKKKVKTEVRPTSVLNPLEPNRICFI